MDNATEWQEVFKTAAKTALVLVILDLMRLNKNASWFEVRRAPCAALLGRNERTMQTERDE